MEIDNVEWLNKTECTVSAHYNDSETGTDVYLTGLLEVQE